MLVAGELLPAEFVVGVFFEKDVVPIDLSDLSGVVVFNFGFVDEVILRRLFARCASRFASSALASRLARSPPPLAIRRSLRTRDRISSKFSSGPPKGSRSQPMRILLQLALTTSTPLGSCAQTNDVSSRRRQQPRINPCLVKIRGCILLFSTLEDVAHAYDYATITSVCSPLVQEVG